MNIWYYEHRIENDVLKYNNVLYRLGSDRVQ